jgi:hypothetical protein
MQRLAATVPLSWLSANDLEIHGGLYGVTDYATANRTQSAGLAHRG